MRGRFSAVAIKHRSESVEMYLKSVAEIGGREVPVPIGGVAERLGVSHVSASEMMKRLVEQGLVTHQPYKGVILTAEGIRVAEGVIRKQRLWECFLIEYLEIDWAHAHDLACELEHATGPEVADALDHFLDRPTVCPHGNPIPRPDTQAKIQDTAPLAELPIDGSGTITAIVPHSSEALAYLNGAGLRPGQTVKVLSAEPLKGPLCLLVGEARTTLGIGLAELVMVKPDHYET